MKPVEAKPIEIKPVQIQLPNQDLHVTAAGIPDKIKVEWDVKPLPVDLRWPKDPVKLSVDVKSSSTEPKDSELSKRVKALETEIANDKNQINTLNEKLTAQRDNYRDAIERTLRSGGLAEEKVSLLMKQLEIQKTEWWGIPIAIFGWILISGILGGVSISIIESFRQRRKRLEQLYELEKIRDKLNAEVAAHAKILNNDKQRLAALDRLIDHEAFMEKFRERHKAELGCWKLLAADWIPAIILGIVAALMVPAVLYFVPGKSLQAAAQNQYLLISLCSICFVVALVGELFIAAVLYRLRNHLQEWADK